MPPEQLHYCWNCDAHCHAEPDDEGLCCPRCRELLSDDARLPLDRPPPAVSFWFSPHRPLPAGRVITRRLAA